MTTPFTYECTYNGKKEEYTLTIYKTNISTINLKNFITTYIHGYINNETSQNNSFSEIKNMFCHKTDQINRDIYKYFVENAIYQYLSYECNNNVVDITIKVYNKCELGENINEYNLRDKLSHIKQIIFSINDKYNFYIDKQNKYIEKLEDKIIKLENMNFFEIIQKSIKNYNNNINSNENKIHNLIHNANGKYKICIDEITKILDKLNINLNKMEEIRKKIFEISLDETDKIKALNTLIENYEKDNYNIIDEFDNNDIEFDEETEEYYKHYEDDKYNKKEVLEWINNKKEINENMKKIVLKNEEIIKELENENKQLTQKIKYLELLNNNI